MSDVLVWDEWAQRIYLVWLSRDIRYAQVALNDVRALADTTPPDPMLWLAVETFLMFSAKVSKMLKPVGVNTGRPRKSNAQTLYDRRKFRGERLCELLGVDRTSVILDRSVRDASEHFDERLDDWTFSEPRPTPEQLENGILPTSAPSPVRLANSNPLVIEVAGCSLNLTAIEGELHRILNRAIEVDRVAAIIDPGRATALAGLPPFPAELRPSAPSRRPHEDVRTGVDVVAATAHYAQFLDAVRGIAE
jgi:hypothetical protein